MIEAKCADSTALSYGAALLDELGSAAAIPDKPADPSGEHPAISWKRAGLFELSGHADGPPHMVPLPLASAANGALMALQALAPDAQLPPSGAQLLGERARLMGLTRNGRSSPTGHCRLLDCADGRIAVNLARAEDWDLLPALLQSDQFQTGQLQGHAGGWDALAAICRDRSAANLIAQGAALGMAIAQDHRPALTKSTEFTESVTPTSWLKRMRLAPPISPSAHRPLVLDLSALWAGPLASSLLSMSARANGADVIKLESTHRPDGSRGGNADFYALMNGGKRAVALDFHSTQGQRYLLRLIAAADIVIEASRPRALRQLGVDANSLIAAKPGKVWLRILAHGDDESRIGFGDDIGAASGLPTYMEQAWGKPMMVGDAIADPLAGIHGALAAWQCWQAGGGELLTLSMRDVVTRAAQAMGDIHASDLSARAHEWQALAEAHEAPDYAPRQPPGPVEALGQSNACILERLPC